MGSGTYKICWIWSTWYARISGYHFLTESRGIDKRSDTHEEGDFLPTETTEEPINIIITFAYISRT